MSPRRGRRQRRSLLTMRRLSSAIWKAIESAGLENVKIVGSASGVRRRRKKRVRKRREVRGGVGTTRLRERPEPRPGKT